MKLLISPRIAWLISLLPTCAYLIIIPVFIPRLSLVWNQLFKTITLSSLVSFNHHRIRIRRRIKDSRGFEIWDANGTKNWTRDASGERKPVSYRGRKFLARMLDRELYKSLDARHPRLFDYSIVYALSIPISPVIKHNLMASSPALEMKTRCRANGIDKSSRSYLNPGRAIREIPLVPSSWKINSRSTASNSPFFLQSRESGRANNVSSCIERNRWDLIPVLASFFSLPSSSNSLRPVSRVPSRNQFDPSAP